MKRSLYFFILLLFSFFLFSCEAGLDDGGTKYSGESGIFSDSGGSSSGSSGSGQSQSGLITAGEWNDLENWDFWNDLMKKDTLGIRDAWQFNTDHRYSFKVVDGNNSPIVDAEVKLQSADRVLWSTRTDNFGTAELWLNMNGEQQASQGSLTVFIDGIKISNALMLYDEGVNKIVMSERELPSHVDIAYIVDATGSMGDEIRFLKDDLKDVLAKANAGGLSMRTAAVFYRDEGDDYLVRREDFSDNIGRTVDFIKNQSAGGGGDYPEAVHVGMEEGIKNLQWSSKAKTRIAFLLLDAPPHNDAQVIDAMNKYTKMAAEKGIKIIPVTASGVNKTTEFLMRHLAIATNGTYVFITNDSGIGNDHIEATVGDYEVEYLNDLMLRLIRKYSE